MTGASLKALTPLDPFHLGRWRIRALVLLAGLGVGWLTPRFPALAVMLGAASLILIVVSLKAEWVVYLWVFSSIFFLYRIEVGPVSMNLYRFLFLLAVLSLPFQSIRRAPPGRRSFLFKAVLIFLLLALFAAGWLRSPQSYRATAMSDFLLLVAWLSMFLFFLYFVDREERWKKVVVVFLITSSLLSFFGIYEYLSWYVTGVRASRPFSYLLEQSSRTEISGLGIPRVESLFHDSNLLGVYLVVAVLLLLAYWRDAERARIRYFAMALIGAHVACILFTFSRSAILLMLISLVLLQFKWFANGGRKPWREAAITIAFGAVSMAVLYLVYPASFSLLKVSINAFEFRLSSGLDTVRRMLMAVGMETFLDSPLAGVGMGTLALKVASQGGKLVDTAHSFYLTILAQYGIIGAVLIGVLLWPVVRKSARTFLRVDSSSLDVSLSLAALVILAFQLVYDNLIVELMLLPFSIVYIWSLRKPIPSSRRKNRDPAWPGQTQAIESAPGAGAHQLPAGGGQAFDPE